jgi:hypothetical protein
MFKINIISKIFLKMTTAVILAVVLVLSMTVVAGTVALGEDGGGVSSDLDMAPQLWYLDSETTPAGYQMEKSNGPGDDGQTCGVYLYPGQSAVWLADQAAVCDVTFSSGSWVAEIRTDSDWGIEGDKCDVSVGGWNENTGWYDIPAITVTRITWDCGFNILTIMLQTESATVYQGDYLALKITNNDYCDDGEDCCCYHVIYTQGRSSLRSPDSDPGYPVPEIATGLLLGLGLFALMGYLGIKKRKVTSVNK